MTININGKRKEGFPTQALFPKQSKLEGCTLGQENQNPNLPKLVEKVDDAVKKIPLAPRASQRCIKQRLESYNKATSLVQKLEAKVGKAEGKTGTSKDAALLEKETRHMERTALGLRSFFQMSLQFRLEDRNNEAEFWNGTHFANPEQHLCHARFLVQRFYEIAPEMKNDAHSRGAIEFIAYLIATKAGEDEFDVGNSYVWHCLSNSDRQLLPRSKLIQLEKIFLMTVGYECLNFDIHLASETPPIVTWKEAIKKGDLPATLSFEKYLLGKALENLKRQTKIGSFQKVSLEYEQAMERFKCAQKCGQTFVDREGQVVTRVVKEHIPEIPFYPAAIAPEEEITLPLEPLFPELQNALDFSILHEHAHETDGNPQCHS